MAAHTDTTMRPMVAPLILFVALIAGLSSNQALGQYWDFNGDLNAGSHPTATFFGGPAPVFAPAVDGSCEDLTGRYGKLDRLGPEKRKSRNRHVVEENRRQIGDKRNAHRGQRDHVPTVHGT